MKENQLSKLVAEALLLGDKDKKRLSKWKEPAAAGQLLEVIPASLSETMSIFYPPRAGDLSSFLVCSARDRIHFKSSKPSLSVTDVNSLLDDLVKCRDNVSRRKWLSALVNRNMTLCDFGWILRIVLKDLRLGIGEEACLTLIHPRAKKLYAETFSLEDTIQRCSVEEFAAEECDVTSLEIQSQVTESPHVEHGTDQCPSSFESFKVAGGVWNSSIRPMLASNLPPHRLCDLFAMKEPKEYSVEPKWDGERCILHVEKKEDGQFSVKSFTRNGFDSTWLYGCVVEKSCSSQLSGLKGVSWVFDAEVLPWDRKSGNALPFAMTKPTALGKFLNSGEETPPVLVLVIFDLIFFNNGEQVFDLMPHSLVDRRTLMEKVVPEEWRRLTVDPATMEVVSPWGSRDHEKRDDYYLSILKEEQNKIGDRPDDSERVVPDCHLFLSPRLKVETREQLSNFVECVQARAEEGIMIKCDSGRYRLGSRQSQDGWFKCKPSLGSLGDSLDVYILGGYLSDRGQVDVAADNWDSVSSYLCAVRLGGSGPERYFSLTKVGGGISNSEQKLLNALLRPLCDPVDPSSFEAPEWLDAIGLLPPTLESYFQGGGRPEDMINEFTKSGEFRKFRLGAGEQPDYLMIDPSDAPIIPVVAAEIVNSKKFGCGVTLRFPRVFSEWNSKFDKPHADGLDLLELVNLLGNQGSGKRAAQWGLKEVRRQESSGFRYFSIRHEKGIMKRSHSLPLIS
eukprot:GHVH01002859.1.p1 GENE.GHVH01002859.1~~GHVH01002859.1.p1  ORF type:complete len:733 (+),score=121.65 GHVH01002859.1:249-2447(+)